MAEVDDHRAVYRQLANVVRNNLEHQQDWTELRVHGDDNDSCQNDGHGYSHNEKHQARLPRILLSGLPPRRLYIHPDEQIAILRAERVFACADPGDGNGNSNSRRVIPQTPEYEWVLPMHLAETPCISQFAAVFDAIGPLPPGAVEAGEASASTATATAATTTATAAAADPWTQWRGAKRNKRILLAIVQDDSTVVYYFVHDGIVKPRQN